MTKPKQHPVKKHLLKVAQDHTRCMIEAAQKVRRCTDLGEAMSALYDFQNHRKGYEDILSLLRDFKFVMDTTERQKKGPKNG